MVIFSRRRRSCATSAGCALRAAACLEHSTIASIGASEEHRKGVHDLEGVHHSSLCIRHVLSAACLEHSAS